MWFTKTVDLNCHGLLFSIDCQVTINFNLNLKILQNDDKDWLIGWAEARSPTHRSAKLLGFIAFSPTYNSQLYSLRAQSIKSLAYAANHSAK